jgi:hypothetical protein
MRVGARKQQPALENMSWCIGTHESENINLLGELMSDKHTTNDKTIRVEASL